MRFSRVFLGAVLAVGCTSRPEVDGVQQGLTVFSADTEAGLTGMYAEGDVAVFFETVREMVTAPDGEEQGFDNAGTPVYIDSRWTDAEGRNIAIGLVGDAVPQGWEQDDSGEQPTLDQLRKRPGEIALMRRAAKLLEAAEVDPAVAAERSLLVGLVKSTESDPATVPASAEDLAENDLTEMAYYNTGKYRQYFNIRNSGCCLGATHHCARWQNQYLDSNGTWYHYSWVDETNHGSGINVENHLGYCYKEPGSTCAVYSPTRTYTKGAISCSTGYGWTGPHNSNTDTVVQKIWVIDGYNYGGSSSYCSGGHAYSDFGGTMCNTGAGM